MYRRLWERGRANRICELKISDYIGDAHGTIRTNLIISRDSFSLCCVYTEADIVSGEREPPPHVIFAFRDICSGSILVCGWGPSSPAWSGSCFLVWPHPKSLLLPVCSSNPHHVLADCWVLMLMSLDFSQCCFLCLEGPHSTTRISSGFILESRLMDP